MAIDGPGECRQICDPLPLEQGNSFFSRFRVNIMSTDSTLRSKWVALALATCAHCQGSGMRSQHGNAKSTPCNCVLRSIFRVVLNKVRECATGAHLLRPFSLIGTNNPRGRRSIGRKSEEFSADVVLAAQRTLDQTELSVFRFFHLLGADWKLCCRRLGMDRGSFYHAVYRVEQKLGCVFLELRPYALYPVDEYFQTTTRSVDVRPFPAPDAPRYQPLRPPLAKRVARPAVALVPAPAPARPAPAPVALDVTDEAAVVRQIRAWFSAGRTPRAIAADLNRLGAPVNRGTQWYASTVRQILRAGPLPTATRPQLRKAA